MTFRAKAYIAAVLLLGAALSWMVRPDSLQELKDWPTFAALTILATMAQLFKAESPNHKLYYATRVFQFAGILLLHPFQVVLLQVICHVTEWAKERLVNSPHLRKWYIQPFNIAHHITASLLARWLYMTLENGQINFLSGTSVLAATLAAIIYMAVNHVFVGIVLVLARGVSLRDLFEYEQLLADFIILSLGYVVAVLWQLNPWLILPVLSPLVLIYQSLMIPLLKQEAQTDPKTELWNARHFNQLFSAEMERAKRFHRPLTLLMADLDLLRNINNTYGHLAGDAVLKGIGRIIRETLREYDIAGRFGGEEFAIALPETEAREAEVIAERLRRAVMNADFRAPTSDEPIKVTISIGLACFPQDAQAATDLIHVADVAVYQAKLRGRNRVVCAADLPHSVRLELRAGRTGIAPHAIDQGSEPRPISEAIPDGRSELAAAADTSSATTEAQTHQSYFWPFVYGVILLGALVTLAGFWLPARIDLPLILLFTVLALLAELLYIDLYEAGSISVSIAIAFATAVVAGIPGVACVSLAIALAHFIQRRPALYKTAFNWATHVLGGVAPALTVYALDLPIEVGSLPLMALPIAAAAFATFVIETGLIATAISLAEGSSPKVTWQQRYRWLAIHYPGLCIIGFFLAIAQIELGLQGIVVFLLPMLMMRYAQKQYVERTEDSMRELRRMNQELTQANREVGLASHSFRQLNDELFLILAKILDARDPYVSGHAAQVAEYATRLAHELELSADTVDQIRQAAFLHDIGKLGISEQILHKPEKLTSEEYEQIKTHAALGASLLETCHSLRHLAPFVRHHHERWDGLGYPEGLRAENIPLEARILAICDAVEVMASDRPYQPALPTNEIINELRRCAGTQFDPNAAEVFARLLEREERLVNSTARDRQHPSGAEDGIAGINARWLAEPSWGTRGQ